MCWIWYHDDSVVQFDTQFGDGCILRCEQFASLATGITGNAALMKLVLLSDERVLIAQDGRLP